MPSGECAHSSAEKFLVLAPVDPVGDCAQSARNVLKIINTICLCVLSLSTEKCHLFTAYEQVYSRKSVDFLFMELILKVGYSITINGEEP